MTHILDLRGVTRHYGASPNLNVGVEDITLSISQGERVAILGHNGVGKSTLGRIIAGLDPEFSGECIRTYSRTNVPVIFQDYRASLLPWLTVEDNIVFPMRLSGASKADGKRRSADLLEQISVDIDARARMRALSGGQAQAVAILRAITMPSCLLVADEPFAALDHEARMSALRLLKEHSVLNAVAVAIITHSIDEAQLFADRVLVLNGSPGRLTGIVAVPECPDINTSWLHEPHVVENRELIRQTIYGDIAL